MWLLKQNIDQCYQQKRCVVARLMTFYQNNLVHPDFIKRTQKQLQQKHVHP